MSSHEQLVQNLDALEGGPLPEEVLKKVDEAWKKAEGKVEYVTLSVAILVGFDMEADIRVCVCSYWHGELKWDYEWAKEKL